MKGKFCPYIKHKFCQEDDCDNCACDPMNWIDWVELHKRAEEPIYNQKENVLN